MTDRTVQPGRPNQLDQLGRFAAIGRNGLLDHHVHATGNEFANSCEVFPGRNGDHGEVRISRRVPRPSRERCRNSSAIAPVAISGRIDRAGELEFRVLLENARVVAADHAKPHDSPARGRGRHVP